MVLNPNSDWTTLARTCYAHSVLPTAPLDHSHQRTAVKSPAIVQTFRQFLQWYHILAVVLFLWASYHQHKCHKILADLRKTKKDPPSVSSLKQTVSGSEPSLDSVPNGTNKQKYGMPSGDWFYYVSCPHLFAEILIYIALLVCQVFSEVACSWWLVVIHVTSSLYLSARQMHSWYQQKFEDYPKNRKSLFPGLC